ncbi:filamentous hemagglutinin N-terminal domain-containing protein [Erwinia tasmaniensis]|uniref:two-partner secretion domain-containing protein n=1 Tax=Erwinia tasmaniensis TaxID=338565 RepID=UPI003A4D30DE
MRNHKFKSIFLATSLALFAQSVCAAPASYVHTSGATVVDINNADSNGLSHNMWKDFNVSHKGMILNNSMTDIIREQGNIAKNGNLTSSAKVILNEVISKKSSALNGFIEVGGLKADVIISNPNGITCSGCSFINTNHTTLTTGTPVVDKDGILSGFKVTRGNITINKTMTADYTTLLADSLIINGQIKSNSIYATAGNYIYNPADGDVEVITKSASTGIDVSALGGMTAGTIFLTSTSTGAGVNNKGVLNAQALQINSKGKITHAGTIETATSAVFNSSDDFTNATQGKIMSNGDITVASSTDITNYGSISSHSGSIAMEAGSSSSGKGLSIISNLFTSSGNITNSGTLSSGKNIGLSSTKKVNLNKGKLDAGNFVYIASDSVKNATAIKGKKIDVFSDAFENTGIMQASTQMVIFSSKDITNYGTLKADTLALSTSGSLVNNKCSLFPFNVKGTLAANSLIIQAPKLASINQIGGNLSASKISFNVPVAPIKK